MIIGDGIDLIMADGIMDGMETTGVGDGIAGMEVIMAIAGAGAGTHLIMAGALIAGTVVIMGHIGVMDGMEVTMVMDGTETDGMEEM